MGTCAAIENTNRNRNYNRKIHSSHKHSNHHNYNDDTNSNKNNNMSSQNDDDDNDDDIIDNNLISNDIQNISNDNNNNSNSNNTSNNNDDISENDYSDNDNNNSINNMNDYNSLYKQNYSHFNKVKLISNPHSIYLQCPNCKSNTLLISHIYYNETQTEYYITYICPCSKVSNKEISIPLKSTLTRELPYQYCKEHKTNILNYYCLDCQVPLCEECKYKYHVTKTVKHILISSKDIYVNHLHKESSKRIRAKLNVLKDKEKAFDLVIEEQKQLLTNEFDKLIQRLKTIKNEYEKEMIEKYHHIKHIFTFVRTLYENYLNNVSNNAIDEFPICSLSHLEYMNLMFDNNNNYSEQIHKMASRAITTNIFDIVGETELPKRRLMFRYDFNFHKQKYNPFDYNYLYYRKGDNDDEYNVNNYNYKQSEQHSIEKEDDVIDNDNDNENNNTVNNKVIYNNNNNKQIIKINTHSNQIQQQVIKVSEQNEIEIHPTIHSNSHQMQMQIQPQTVIKKDISNLSFPLECKNTLQGHQNKVITIIFLSSLCSSGQGYKLASGGCDNTIKIWDSQYDISSFHYEIEKTLIETNNVLTLLEFEPNLLLSGTAGNVINLWSLYTNQKLYTFIEHKLWVNCLIKLTNNHFASCSNDSKIIVWNYSSKTKEGEMAEHSDCVLTMILLDNNNICSGSADNSIKMWNWNECKCIMNMLGHEQWVKCLCQMENGDIVSGSDDKTIKIWRNGCCIRTIQGHEDAVRTVCVYQRKYLLSGGFDCSIRVWDVKNEWKCLQVTKEHNANVICIIKRDDVGIVSCSNDNTIKLWKWNYEGN